MRAHYLGDLKTILLTRFSKCPTHAQSEKTLRMLKRSQACVDRGRRPPGGTALCPAPAGLWSQSSSVHDQAWTETTHHLAHDLIVTHLDRSPWSQSILFALRERFRRNEAGALDAKNGHRRPGRTTPDRLRCPDAGLTRCPQPVKRTRQWLRPYALDASAFSSNFNF